METKFCSKCGVKLWDWVETCPDCNALQSEWNEGKRLCSICKKNEATLFLSPFGNPDEPALCYECSKLKVRRCNIKNRWKSRNATSTKTQNVQKH